MCACPSMQKIILLSKKTNYTKTIGISMVNEHAISILRAD